SLGDIVNKYVNDNAPWILIKNDPEKAREVVTTALNSAKILFLYLYPVIPQTSQKVFHFLGINGVPDFSILSDPIENIQLPAYEHITQRANEKGIQEMIEETKNEYEKAQLLANKANSTDSTKSTSPTDQPAATGTKQSQQ